MKLAEELAAREYEKDATYYVEMPSNQAFALAVRLIDEAIERCAQVADENCGMGCGEGTNKLIRALKSDPLTYCKNSNK